MLIWLIVEIGSLQPSISLWQVKYPFAMTTYLFHLPWQVKYPFAMTAYWSYLPWQVKYTFAMAACWSYLPWQVKYPFAMTACRSYLPCQVKYNFAMTAYRSYLPWEIKYLFARTATGLITMTNYSVIEPSCTCLECNHISLNVIKMSHILTIFIRNCMWQVSTIITNYLSSDDELLFFVHW